MPHELTEREFIVIIIVICLISAISEMLLKHGEMEPFLKQIITDDGKLIKYKDKERYAIMI